MRLSGPRQSHQSGMTKLLKFCPTAKKTKLNIYPNDFDLHTRTFSNACLWVWVCIYLIFALIEFRTCALGSLELKVSFALQQHYLWFYHAPKETLYSNVNAAKPFLFHKHKHTRILYVSNGRRLIASAQKRRIIKHILYTILRRVR